MADVLAVGMEGIIKMKIDKELIYLIGWILLYSIHFGILSYAIFLWWNR